MTTRQIRDIASYWNAPCSFDFPDETNHNYRLPDGEINPQAEFRRAINQVVGTRTLTLLAGTMVRNLKLHLRSISSLSDEEITECCKIDSGGDFRYGGVYHIGRYSSHIEAAYANGAGINLPPDYDHWNPAILAYLQSIGVYVPGCIDMEFVSLIE